MVWRERKEGEEATGRMSFAPSELTAAVFARARSLMLPPTHCSALSPSWSRSQPPLLFLRLPVMALAEALSLNQRPPSRP